MTVDTGFSGFEGPAYASDVVSKNRNPEVTMPKVELQVASDDLAAKLEPPKGQRS